MEDLHYDLTLLPSEIKSNHLTFLNENLDKLLRASNLHEIFVHLNLYWDHFNYTLLEIIVNEYGSDTLKQEMKTYVSDMAIFRHETTIAEFIPSIRSKFKTIQTIPREFTEIKHVIKYPISGYTLAEVEQLRRELCQSYHLPEFAVILFKLETGSMVVTWLVASELKEQLKDAMKSKPQQTIEIMYVSVGGECVYKVSKCCIFTVKIKE